MKAAILGLAAVALVAVVAPWLAPRPPALQEDLAGARYLPPLTRAHAVPAGSHRTWIVTGLEQGPAMRAGTAVELTAEQRAHASARFYLLGTDGLGRDLTSRLLHGVRHAAGIAGAAVVLALLLGVLVGSVAGFLGGAWDAVVMRLVDVFLATPRLLVYLLCAALLQPSTWLLVVVLGATTWTGLARIVRAEVRSLRNRPFAAAAVAAGASRRRVLAAHLLPQLRGVLAVTAALRFADTVLLEAALAFMGLGSPPPAVSLGAILAAGRDAPGGAWWIVVFPGLSIAAMVAVVRTTVSRLFGAGEAPSVV